jgi:hypothetical protein
MQVQSQSTPCQILPPCARSARVGPLSLPEAIVSAIGYSASIKLLGKVHHSYALYARVMSVIIATSQALCKIRKSLIRRVVSLTNRINPI